MENIRRKCGFRNGIDVGAIGSRGGLSLGWKENSLFNLRSFTNHHIDAHIHDNESGETWRIMGFYDNLDERHRSSSWELLKKLSLEDDTSWLVVRTLMKLQVLSRKKEADFA